MPLTSIQLPEIGTVLGIVPEGETLAGWVIVATGDGRAITTKSGACWGRYGDESADVPADLARNAVDAYLWTLVSDEELEARIAEWAAKVADSVGSASGARAALDCCVAERVRRASR